MYNKRGLATSRIVSIVMLALISSVALLQLTGTIDILKLTDTIDILSLKLSPEVESANSNKVDDNIFILKNEGKEGVPYEGGVTFGDDNDPPERVYLDPDSTIDGLPPGITLSSDGELTGIPDKAGTYTFRICADWADGGKVCQKDSLTIKPKSEPTPKLAAGPGLSGRWEGTYKVHIIFDGVWTCTTYTTAPISICLTQQGQEVTGIITFPEGFKDTTISAEPDLQCSAEPHCRGDSGDQCSDFIGQIDSNGIFSINSLTLDGWEYTFNPNYPETSQGKKQASATISTNSMTFNFDSEASSSTNAGSFTAIKVSDDCNTLSSN